MNLTAILITLWKIEHVTTRIMLNISVDCDMRNNQRVSCYFLVLYGLHRAR